MKVNPNFKRDKFSGHWWIKYPELNLNLEVYYSRISGWVTYGIYSDTGCPLTRATRLDKSNIVYLTYCKQIIPEFHSLRALIRWIEVMSGVNIFDFVR